MGGFLFQIGSIRRAFSPSVAVSFARFYSRLVRLEEAVRGFVIFGVNSVSIPDWFD